MTSLTERTERALLGGLLINPAAAAISFLQRTDFADRNRGDILAAIRGAHHAGHGPGAGWLQTVAAAAAVTIRDLDGMRADCPVPRHVNAYAGLVMEARVRRIITGIADRLILDSGAFDFDARRMTSLRAPAAGMTDTLSRHLEALATAFKTHTEFDPGTWQPIQASGNPPQPLAFPASLPARAWQPSRLRDQSGPRARAEERVLAGLLQRHLDTPQVIAAVTPGMFTSPLRKTIYQTLQAMHHHDQPIDYLTVEWGLARRLTGAAPVPVPAEHSASGTGYLTQLTHAPTGPGGIAVAAMQLAEQAGPAAISGPHQPPVPDRPALRLLQPPPQPGPHPDGPAPMP